MKHVCEDCGATFVGSCRSINDSYCESCIMDHVCDICGSMYFHYTMLRFNVLHSADVLLWLHICANCVRNRKSPELKKLKCQKCPKITAATHLSAHKNVDAPITKSMYMFKCVGCSDVLAEMEVSFHGIDFSTNITMV